MYSRQENSPDKGKGEEQMRIKIKVPAKDYGRYMQRNEHKAFARHKKLIDARPKEHVDPVARDKSVIGTCNR